jgi:hypothetical protein
VQDIFLAFTTPVAGREDAFNEWYDSRHVPEVLQYGRGFVGCQRFKLRGETQSGAIVPWKYVAMYDLRCDDLAALAERPWVVDSPPLTSFRGLLEDDHVGWTFSARDSPQPEPDAGRQGRSKALRILLAWRTAALVDSRVRSPRESARWTPRVYELAGPQRRGQLDCPWRGLVIYPIEESDGLPSLDGFDGAWMFVPVSRYVERSEL